MNSVLHWLRRQRQHLLGPTREVPETLWQTNLSHYPFLIALTLQEQAILRHLSTHFLSEKEFHGANGQQVTDAAALAVATQACLPLVHWSRGEKAPSRPHTLDWYDDFVGIILYPGAIRARRHYRDATGLVHEYSETIAGEAMQQGPVVLSWPDVQQASDTVAAGHNLVIHEFVHKLDMCDGQADGVPPLPRGFLGTRDPRTARRTWLAHLQVAFDRFREQINLAERFGGPPVWLNTYGTQSLTEFFAVTCEAYFVNRDRFTEDFGDLVLLFDAFFKHRSALMA
ncbi:MAG: zinc-dependent peptidase [Betaproteobacteria bacterium]|jgi:Mlc titration factor MtfA (ptsG expression regulator)|nr:zinc-dependent peptidase [Betaproteobacteria bacterium]MBP7780035.1 zinc-dependent peptidase [Burkholderiaceae bacterium]